MLNNPLGPKLRSSVMGESYSMHPHHTSYTCIVVYHTIYGCSKFLTATCRLVNGWTWARSVWWECWAQNSPPSLLSYPMADDASLLNLWYARLTILTKKVMVDRQNQYRRLKLNTTNLTISGGAMIRLGWAIAQSSFYLFIIIII